MAVFADIAQRQKVPAASEPDEILRFQACERHLHWAIAIPFKVCYLTALILVTVYNPAPARPFRDVFAWTHRVSGICLALLPPLALFIHRREFRLHWRNVIEGWSWRLDDIKWLFLMGPATVNKRVKLPDQGKFNAAEKINFAVVMSTYPLYIATGLTIWFFRPAFLAWLIHFAMATFATPLVLGHIFMATVNPDTRVGLKGMITGWVSREWAEHHYRRWYDEHFGHVQREAVHAVVAVERPALPATPRASVDAVVSAAQPVVPRAALARPAIAPRVVAHAVTSIHQPARSAAPRVVADMVANVDQHAVPAASRVVVLSAPVSGHPVVAMPMPAAPRPAPAPPVAGSPEVASQPAPLRPVTPIAAAASAEPSSSRRPAKILWPQPDTRTADPSFAS